MSKVKIPTKGKEYTALLYSSKLDVKDYECDAQDVKCVSDLGTELSSIDYDWLQNVDDTMLKTGFNSFITLDSEDMASRNYLCKRLRKLPESVVNVLNMCLDEYFLKKLGCPDFTIANFDDDNGFSSLDVTISESPDNEDALLVNSHIIISDKSEDCNTVSFSKEDFYNKNIPSSYVSFTDMVNLVLKEFKGITVDRLSLYMSSNLAVDLKNGYNKNAFSYFIGVSRVYDMNWWVSDNPVPLTDSTYEVCIMIVPTHSRCVVKRKDYYKRVLEYINSKDCDIDWEEIEDVNGNVIGYKNSFCKLMKNDTVESLMSRDVNSMKK